MLDSITGYGTTSDSEMMGNFGLLDIIQALRFVKENIAAFNGDPNSVTLMGESAGASNAGLLIVSPLSKGISFFLRCSTFDRMYFAG